MGNKLYVGNLPYSVRDEDLQQSFGQFGAVTSAKAQGRTRQAVRAEQDELTRLKRENEMLRKERDFVKRAAAFFARESP